MHRVWSVGLVVVAVVVFALAGYVLVHDDAVHRAGKTPRQPVADTLSPSTASSPALPEPVVAFLGDDWTSGIGASNHAHRFTALVSAALHLQERNFGSAGSGYARQGRTGGDYASRIPDVVAADPAMVVVSGGRNDVAEDPAFVGQRARLVFERLRTRLPKAVVVVIAPMWGDSPAPKALRRVAGEVRQAAHAAGVRYVGITDPIRGHANYMANAADPDDRGYAAIAAVLEKRLASQVPR